MHSAVDGALGNGGGIYMRGYVLQTRQEEGIIVRMVAVVAHQCALRVLRAAQAVNTGEIAQQCADKATIPLQIRQSSV